MSYSELELIQWLKHNAPLNNNVLFGIGDDAAVLEYSKDSYQLYKVDAIAENIHYYPDTDPLLIGRKALARPLSDIAAMGGKPTSALISIAMDRNRSKEYIQAVFQGIFTLAKHYGVSIAGGETIRLEQGVTISVSLLGTVRKDNVILRSGAKAGDKILITGRLGKADQGKHLTFEPRLHESEWLTETVDVHSMIDVSDGLIGDLHKLLSASNKGAKIVTEMIPLDISENNDKKELLKKALTWGEEFELLFTCCSVDAQKVLTASRDFRTDITCIGEITDEDDAIRLVDENGNEKLVYDKGYDHFEDENK